MIHERFLQWLSDIFFLRRLRRAIKKHQGRALCFHCLNLLDWHNYQDREIRINVSTCIMLFCPACHERAMNEDNQDGEWIVRAFRRWYTYSSGYPQDNSTEQFNHALENVLEYYGWVPKLEPVGDIHEAPKSEE